MSNPFCVITTINPPTRGVEVVAAKFPPGNLIVVGDRKTPTDWAHGGAEFLGVKGRDELTLQSAKLQTQDHYAVKNLGYLRAMQRRASLIYDTDDDNIPNAEWHMRDITCAAYVETKRGWHNVYNHFHESDVWPRGFPLQHILTDHRPTADYDGITHYRMMNLVCPVQQGLANLSPDVDAIWRLTVRDVISFAFEVDLSVALAPDTWCPFNSQTTWWWPVAYPLLYLPTYATFRMTDIWRSLVAQRCLWAMCYGVVFHSPSEVMQDRNPHDLLKDFKDEIPGYLNNHLIVECLNNVPLAEGIQNTTDNLRACYLALIESKILPEVEMVPLNAWIHDVHQIKGQA